MNRVLKTLLLWLLILALPAQGFAAAQLACGPAHHDKVPIGAPASVHTHDAIDHVGHVHEHEDQAHEIQNAAADEAAPDSSSSFHKHATAKCSACAACCVGAAMSPTVLTWPQPHDSVTVRIVASAAAFSGHIPAGLERPPRVTLS